MASAETSVRDFISVHQSGSDSRFISEQSSVVRKTFGLFISYLLPAFQPCVLVENQLSGEVKRQYLLETGPRGVELSLLCAKDCDVQNHCPLASSDHDK